MRIPEKILENSLLKVVFRDVRGHDSDSFVEFRLKLRLAGERTCDKATSFRVEADRRELEEALEQCDIPGMRCRIPHVC